MNDPYECVDNHAEAEKPTGLLLVVANLDLVQYLDPAQCDRVPDIGRDTSKDHTHGTADPGSEATCSECSGEYGGVD